MEFALWVYFFTVYNKIYYSPRAIPWDDVGTERLTGMLEGPSTPGAHCARRQDAHLWLGLACRGGASPFPWE